MMLPALDARTQCVRSGAARPRLPRAARLGACALTLVGGLLGFAGHGLGQTQTSKAETPAGDPVKEVKVEPGLEGSWKGGGEVAFAVTGSRERARCRAHYVRKTKDTYAMNATCATASGKASQVATVHKVGENRYRGNFHNPEYDIGGTIFVVVNGNSQSVRLSSTSGSALFRLSR
ncbi:MAG TPA: hypothetical protein VJ740_08685 [Hyphomicrobiaceae bacterium]|nr:hypothetical protein [Hyphomicrobiaceae bacterium]